jgi:hypothetical protein
MLWLWYGYVWLWMLVDHSDEVDYANNGAMMYIVAKDLVLGAEGVRDIVRVAVRYVNCRSPKSGSDTYMSSPPPQDSCFPRSGCTHAPQGSSCSRSRGP